MIRRKLLVLFFSIIIPIILFITQIFINNYNYNQLLDYKNYIINEEINHFGYWVESPPTALYNYYYKLIDDNTIIETKTFAAIIPYDMNSEDIKKYDKYIFVNINQLDDYNYELNYRKITDYERISADTKELGNYGRLYIPKYNIDVAINYTDSNNLSTQQWYVDKEDSACMSPYGVESFLCDHYHQGFYNIVNIIPGDLMYIKRKDDIIETWECKYGGDGINGVYDMLTFNNKSIASQNHNGICLYTCHGNDSYNVYMRFFQKK